MNASLRRLLLPRLSGAWLLALALVITVSIVTASQLFTDRIGRMLDRQAAELLAADLLIVSSEPLPDSWKALARAHGLNTAETVSLRSAVFLDDAPQLIELKAVSRGYPLRGQLEIRDRPLSPARRVEQGPEAGELWVDGKLAALLGERIELGEARLPVTRLIAFEPDRGGSLFNLAPRVMMALEDLGATGLIVPGSRARYRLLVAGEASALRAFRSVIEPLLREGQQIQGLDNARPELRRTLERTRSFFALATLLTLVIAMIAIALTAAQAAAREQTMVAVMRGFGISGGRLFRHQMMQLFKLWLWATPAGLLLGWLAQFPLQGLLGAWFGLRLPEATVLPYAQAALVTAFALLGFSLPPLLRLLDTPPSQVLRDLPQPPSLRARLLRGISLLALYAIIWLMLGQAVQAAVLLLVILLIAGLMPLILRAPLRLLLRRSSGRFWLFPYLYSRLLTPGRQALTVVTGFSITLMALLLLTLVKDALLEDWALQLPKDRPNYFMVNIPPERSSELESWLAERDIAASPVYPLVRARLTAINGVPVSELRLQGNEAHRLVNHVFNLSWSETLPPDNVVTAGNWAPEQGFSVEQGMAEELGIALDDRLQFSVGGEVFEAPVNSIRSVLWENFRPNFYVLAPGELLQNLPRTALLSARVTPEQEALLKPLLERFPGVLLLDVSELMDRILGIIDRASLSLQFFLAFALLAGLLVLLSVLAGSRAEREREMALLRALGASSRQLRSAQLGELMLMGLMAGLFAALLAQLIGWVVAVRLFDLQPALSPRLWLGGALAGMLMVSLPGWLFLRRGLRIRPMRLLRG